jgi:hypothetical protein
MSEDPLYTGDLDWAQFNPSEFQNPAAWVSENLHASQLAGIQTLLLDFISVNLADLPDPASSDVFKLLPSMTYVIDKYDRIDVQIDINELLQMEYNDRSAYVMPLIIVNGTGEAQVSIIWLDDEKLEVFSPFVNEEDNYEELLMNAIESLAKPELARFVYGDENAPLETINYKLPTTWDSSNWWSHYFILARIFKGSQRATQRLFSDSTVPAELLESRDTAVVALVELAIACVQTTQVELYNHLFGSGAHSQPLTRHLITVDLHNIFTRCGGNQDRNWYVLKNAFPGIVAQRGEDRGTDAALTGFENLPAWPRDVTYSKEMKRFIELPGARMPVFYVR